MSEKSVVLILQDVTKSMVVTGNLLNFFVKIFFPLPNSYLIALSSIPSENSHISREAKLAKLLCGNQYFRIKYVHLAKLNE